MSMLDLILNTLQSEKAEDIVTLDLADKSSMADHMVVASGRSTRQVVALAEKIADKLKQVMEVQSRIEGKQAGDWVLLDAGGVIRTLDDAQRAEWVSTMKPVWEQFVGDVGQENIDAAQAINAKH